MRWGSGRHPPRPPRRLGDGSPPLPPDGWRGHRRSTTWGLLSMFDKAKLDALRAKYEGAKETEVAPEKFRKPLSLVFGSAYRRAMPYAGLSTFLDAPYRPDAPDLPDFAGLDVALVGVPMDLGVTNRAGARLGPRAVRDVERIGPYNHALEVTPRGECNVADIGDVPLRSRFSLDNSIEDIAAFYARIQAAGVRPLSVGGDHSVTYPILKSLGAERAGRPRPYRRPLRHDGRGRRIEVPSWRPVPPGGARRRARPRAHDPDRHPRPRPRSSGGFPTIRHDRAADRGCRPARHRRGCRKGACRRRRRTTYISFDVDGLDPAYTPGTGTPEAGGLTPREAQAILHGLKGLDIVGGDVVEVAPQYDATTNTAMVGAQMLFEIFCLTVLGPHFKRRTAQ